MCFGCPVSDIFVYSSAETLILKNWRCCENSIAMRRFLGNLPDNEMRGKMIEPKLPRLRAAPHFAFAGCAFSASHSHVDAVLQLFLMCLFRTRHVMIKVHCFRLLHELPHAPIYIASVGTRFYVLAGPYYYMAQDRKKQNRLHILMF